MTWFLILSLIVGIPLGIILLILLIGLSCSFIDIFLPPKIVFKKKGKIVAVNGIKDNDTGLLSNGSTNLTSLLFEDGEIININESLERVRLNVNCKVYFKKTKIMDEESFYVIKYAKLEKDGGKNAKKM